MKSSTLFYLIFLLISLISSSLYSQNDPITEADAYIKSGRLQAALDVLDSYLERNPRDAKGYIKRAIAHERLGHSDQRERDLEYAKYLNPYAFMYISEAIRYKFYNKKQYEYDFENISSDFNTSPVKQKYYDIYLDEVREIHSQDSLISSAIYAFSKNNLNEAEKIISQIHFEDENYSSGILYDLEGLVKLKNGRVEESIEYFSKSIEVMPYFPLAYHNRAVAHKLMGNFEAANNDLMKAIELNEDISVFYFTLAKLNEKLNAPQKAMDLYEEALVKNPNYVEARTNYSTLQKTLGNYEESINELKKILTENNEKSKVHFLNGGIHFTYGEYEDAILEFNKYLTYKDNDSDAIFNRGMAKILMGKKKDGCDDISLSLEIERKSNREEIQESFCFN